MKGILSRSEMIRAIVNGSKTVTRRVIKPQPFIRDGVIRWTPKTGIDINLTDHSDLAIPFARYKVGEVVYIKEACWYPPEHNQNRNIVAYRLIVSQNCGEEAASKNIWKSPMFMPAWAARYFIKILAVEACRTRDITPEDCIAEGIVAASSQCPTVYTWPDSKNWYATPQAAYFALYDSINGKGTHERNWDFRYTFRQTVRKE